MTSTEYLRLVAEADQIHAAYLKVVDLYVDMAREGLVAGLGSGFILGVIADSLRGQLDDLSMEKLIGLFTVAVFEVARKEKS